MNSDISNPENKKEKYFNKGLTGLANLGNSCYKNSCMQILSHTYRLNDLLDNENYKKKLNRVPDSLLLVEWDKLRTLMWSENCTVSPAGWNQAVIHVARQNVAAQRSNCAVWRGGRVVGTLCPLFCAFSQFQPHLLRSSSFTLLHNTTLLLTKY